MNKTAIKNYAIRGRVQLIEAVKQRAYEYEITEDGENKSGIKTVGDRLLTPDEIKQREQLIDEIRHKGYNQVMEEAAYTWFNRFIALRFMEVNGFLPSRVRVFTDESGAFKPEILKEAMTVDIDGLDRNKVFDLLDRQENEELFKYLIITQCNALNQGLPYMFEKISNWTELLFPANLLRSDSVIGSMISDIPEDNWQDAVQIIGWMYQYYNTELKDDTFARLKKNIKISKERIPAATQLFTPDWIVRYMVENSLGRIYISDQLSVVSDQSESERVAAEKALAEKMGWKYYLPEAEQEPEVRAQLNSLTTNHYELTTLKIIDPCMGSGHILVYAFDVLLQIYTACGWSERDAAKSILENNLYGLDIDDRAGQLAYFAIMMKARKHSRRILNGETRPNVLAIQDSGFMTEDFISYVSDKNQNMKADLTLLRSSLKDAKEYGSILNVPVLNYAELYERIDIISRSFAEDLFQAQYQTMAVELLLPLVKQAEIMAQKYDVVVTNPPYMGASGMSAKLSEFVKKHYPTSKSDMFAIFIEKCGSMAKKDGYYTMITQQSFFFLSGLEKLRYGTIATHTLINAVHMGLGAFGNDFGTVAFVFKKGHIKNFIGGYVYLGDEKDVEEKKKLFLSGNAPLHFHSMEEYALLPNCTYSYMIDKKTLNLFSKSKLADYYVSGGRNKTHKDEQYIRFYWEVSKCSDKWVPYGKGGEFRKWYGNEYYIVDWSESARNFYASHGGLCNTKFWNREGITWSFVTSYKPSFRYKRAEMIYSSVSPTIFRKEFTRDKYVLALLNSSVGTHFLRIISSTIGTNVGEVLNFPVPLIENCAIDYITEKNISLSREDWDSFETSWDFKKHPLV